jgi:hypothetical protein
MIRGAVARSRQELRTIPTLAQFISERTSRTPHINATKRSRKTDEYLLRVHILPALGRLSLDEITSGG